MSNADDLLQRVKRDLRELGLAERAGVFERRGVAIARVTLQGDGVQAAVVQRPSRNSPQWQPQRALTDSAAARDFIADLKTKLARWSDRDDG